MAPTTRTQQLQLAAASPPMEKKTCPVQLPRAAAAADELVAGRWRSSLASGLRAALACIIVGLVSLYAPPALRRHITFPAFSYVVTVIIVTDATLGTALRGAVSALQATLMGATPSVLALWLAHRTGAAVSVLATSAVVALTTFAVALPESVDPVAKRIALGQIIIIYVARFHKGDHPTRAFALLHPANVVACTALGVAAALLAVLLPWPRLAARKATDKVRAYRALAAERVRVMVDAAIIFTTGGGGECTRQRRWQMAACVSEANRLASASAALLRRINAIKEEAQWERRRAIAVDYDGVETPLSGMQMALSMMVIDGTTDDDSKQLLQEEHRADIMAMRNHIRLALLTPNRQPAASFVSKQFRLPPLPRTTTTLQMTQDPCWLFLFSLYQLRGAAAGLLLGNDNADANANKKIAPAATPAADRGHQQSSRADEQGIKTPPPASATAATKKGKLVAAAKCGFSLGLAVLLGLLFNNEHGFWSGLIVATTMSTGRDSTWAVAAARAHGTALGSVYGALGCLLISQQQPMLMDLRLLALVPWMVVATFLKRSHAYSPAGGVAAALSVVIIMGRRYDEPPMAFIVARLVETFVGISCVVTGDLLFQPGARPSVMAREHLTRWLLAARSGSADGQSQSLITKSLALLRRHVAEAAGEPSYLWLPPFPAACYERILGSLGRMARLLHLYHQARVAAGVDADEDMMRIHRRFSSIVSTSLGHCLRVLSSSPPPPADHPHHHEAIIKDDDDLEAGNDGGISSSSSCCCCCKEEVLGTFLAHAGEAAAALLDLGDDDEVQALLVYCLGSMGMCMGEIIREAQRLEAHIIDLNNLQPH